MLLGNEVTPIMSFGFYFSNFTNPRLVLRNCALPRKRSYLRTRAFLNDHNNNARCLHAHSTSTSLFKRAWSDECSETYLLLRSIRRRLFGLNSNATTPQSFRVTSKVCTCTVLAELCVHVLKCSAWLINHCTVHYIEYKCSPSSREKYASL